MGEWLLWAARVAAAGVMLLIAAVFLVVGIASGESRAFGLSVAAVTGIGGWLSWPRRPNAWRRDPPTQRQLDYAESLGIAVPPRATKGQVSDLISQVTGR